MKLLLDLLYFFLINKQLSIDDQIRIILKLQKGPISGKKQGVVEIKVGFY